MSWLFSQALVEASWGGRSTDDESCAQLNVMPTPHKFWRNDRTMESSRLSQFGLTLRLLTEADGERLLMSYLAGFPAKTSAPLATEPESTVYAADSGDTWRGSFAKLDRDLLKWKTAQCSLLGDSEEFLETWPRWGSMRNGASYLRPTPALRICESASGLWPTPTATLGTKGGRVTPRKGREGGTLIEAVSARRWPTPCASASASKGSSPAALTRKSGASRANDRIDHAVMASDGGQLNPEWVEWLMGWPIGWTELKPLAMDRFREWRQQHSTSWPQREMDEAA